VTANFTLTATITDAQPTHPAVFPATTSAQSHKPTETMASKINHCELPPRTPYVCHPQKYVGITVSGEGHESHLRRLNRSAGAVRSRFGPSQWGMSDPSEW